MEAPCPLGHGFPAHAGMDHERRMCLPGASRFPRTRGDGPRAFPLKLVQRWVSPHTRGWTRHINQQLMECKGFPAHAGMDPRQRNCQPSARRFPRTRGDGPRQQISMGTSPEVSPHTRGWTRIEERRRVLRAGFPAHAGMDPCTGHPPDASNRFPRTRGDGPPTCRRSE